MRNVAGPVRAGLVALGAVAAAVAATQVSGSVQLGRSVEGSGLPQSSTVLVDEAGLVCPGQQRLGAVGLRDVQGTVTVAAAAPGPGVVPGVPSGSGRAEIVGGSTTLAATDRTAAVVSATSAGPEPVVARASGPLAPGLVATQVWSHRGDDDRGLAVTPCQQPSSDVWLVAGGAGASRTERLIVTNPGSNAVSASFEVLGEKGRVPGIEERSVSIPPGARAVVSLDALAPDEPGPVVHVTSTGGVVSAVLDEQLLEGAVGRGIDDATRAAPPSTDQVVAGIDGEGFAAVRMGNPGDSEALVQVRLLTERGVVQPTELRAVRVPAGSTVTLRLPLTAGAFGLGLRSDEPVVAAAWSNRLAATGDRMGDFAWSPATPAVRGVAGVTLPGLGGATKRLLLTSGAGPATVEVHSGTGTAERITTVNVPAESTRAVALGDTDVVWVVPRTGTVRAAVSVVTVDGGVPAYAVASLTDAPLRALSVPVRQVRN